MELNVTGGVCLPAEQDRDDTLELIAARLETPLALIKLSAESMADQLRASAGDPEDISAAESLIHSAEKMHRIIQALIDASRGAAP